MKHRARIMIVVAGAMSITGCRPVSSPQTGISADRGALVGAWRSRVSFRSGPLADLKGLEFLYAYNAGGTMTESSNYDEAANSSPPAYGVWKQVETRKFETKYLFYTTKAASPGDGAPTGSDWWPDGHGVLTETIELSADGRTYASTIRLATFDKAGGPIGAVSEGTGAGERIEF